MQIAPRELASVAAAAAPRFDMYSGIHKALRALMADTLLAVGRMDSADDLELAQVTERVLGLLQFCAGHLRHENDFVHAAIEARARGASEAIGHEHGQHEKHVARLAEIVGVLSDIRAKAPAPAFQAILDKVQPHLATGEWAKLARALGLPPVPGLVAV